MVPAMRVLRPSVGKRVMARMPDSPAVSLAQLSVLPAPSEVTTPSPVTTTIGRPILSLVDGHLRSPSADPFDQSEGFAPPVADTGHQRPWLKSPLIGRSNPVESQGGNRLPWPSATVASATFIGNCGSSP